MASHHFNQEGNEVVHQRNRCFRHSSQAYNGLTDFLGREAFGGQAGSLCAMS
jgi:hypothetical protein